MLTISISDLKANPASVILKSFDYPVAIQKRSKTQAYLVGKEIFEKLVAKLEDEMDRKAIEEADFSTARDYEEVARELGL